MNEFMLGVVMFAIGLWLGAMFMWITFHASFRRNPEYWARVMFEYSVSRENLDKDGRP